MLVLEQMRFVSVVSTCEAVGNTHRRRAISDRDMRSERPGLNDPPRCAAKAFGLRSRCEMTAMKRILTSSATWRAVSGDALAGGKWRMPAPKGRWPPLRLPP